MSALPYGSSIPYGSALPQQAYGSAAPFAYPTYGSAYGSAYPSYDQGFQQFPTYSAAQALPTYVASVPGPAPAKEADQKRKQTALEEQLAAVKELEKQLEQAVHELELEHVKLNQKHSTEFTSLFQQQTHVLVIENQKVVNAVNGIPESIMTKLNNSSLKDLPLPDSKYPPIGTSQPPGQNPSSNDQHPMYRMQETQKYITQLRKGLEKQINDKF